MEGTGPHAAAMDLTKGLAPHYYFNYGVHLQVVGERKSTRAEERVLHFDLAYGALKFVQKEQLRLTIKLDVINQVIYDESEPRSVLVSCHDDRRYLVDFQNAEENQLFRSAFEAVVNNTFDITRFNRFLLKKGSMAKKMLRGYQERYLILVPRKLYIMSSKTAFYPRSVISLLDANPRFDEMRACLHLDVMGKEYVLRCDTKEETLEWYVAIAQGCGLTPMFMDDDDMSEAGELSYPMQSSPRIALRGIRTGSAPASTAPAYQVIARHTAQPRRLASHQGIPLPGMPGMGSMQHSLQDYASPYAERAGVKGSSTQSVSGPDSRSLRMGSGGMSLSGSRQAAQGSLPGPLTRNLAQRQQGRSLRQGSLPGPNTAPAGSAVEVPFDFHQGPGPYPSPTKATARGILREKSNTSPWLTEGMAQPSWAGQGQARQADWEASMDGTEDMGPDHMQSDTESYTQPLSSAGRIRGASRQGSPAHRRLPTVYEDNKGSSMRTQHASHAKMPAPPSNRPYSVMTDDDLSTFNGDESDVTDTARPPWPRTPAARAHPASASGTPSPAQWFASADSRPTGNNIQAEQKAQADAGQGSSSPLQQATFSLLQDMQSRLERMEADVRTATSASISSIVPAVLTLKDDPADVAPPKPSVGGSPVQAAAVDHKPTAYEVSAQPPAMQASMQQAGMHPSAAAAISHTPWSADTGHSKGRQQTLMGWGPAPVPYVSNTTTGEAVTSAWLRDRTTSAWSTGTADYMGRLRASCLYGPHSGPGMVDGPMLVPDWRARAAVEDVPCIKPSVVAENTRYLQGRSGRHPAVRDLRSASRSAAGAGQGVEQAHRRNSTLMRWMFANYERLEQDPRNPEPQVVLAQADKQQQQQQQQHTHMAGSSVISRSARMPSERPASLPGPRASSRLQQRHQMHKRVSRMDDPVAAARLEWMELRECDEEQLEQEQEQEEDTTTDAYHGDHMLDSRLSHADSDTEADRDTLNSMDGCSGQQVHARSIRTQHGAGAAGCAPGPASGTGRSSSAARPHVRQSYLVEDMYKQRKAPAQPSSRATQHGASPARLDIDRNGSMSHLRAPHASSQAKGADERSSRTRGSAGTSHDLYTSLLAQHRLPKQAPISRATDSRPTSRSRSERPGVQPNQALQAVDSMHVPYEHNRGRSRPIPHADASDCETVASEASSLASSKDKASSRAAERRGSSPAPPASVKTYGITAASLSAGHHHGLKASTAKGTDQDARADPTILELHPDISHLLPGMSLTLRVRRTNGDVKLDAAHPSPSNANANATGSGGKTYLPIDNPLYQPETDRGTSTVAVTNLYDHEFAAVQAEAGAHEQEQLAQLMQALQQQGLVLPGAYKGNAAHTPYMTTSGKFAPTSSSLDRSSGSGPNTRSAPHMSAESSESIQRAAVAAGDAASSAVSDALAALLSRSKASPSQSSPYHSGSQASVGLSTADTGRELNFQGATGMHEQPSVRLDRLMREHEHDSSSGSTAMAYMSLPDMVGADPAKGAREPASGSKAFRATSLQSLLQAVSSGQMSSVELLAGLSQGVPLTAIVRGKPVVGTGAL